MGDRQMPELDRSPRADMIAQVARLYGGGERLVSNTIWSQHLKETKERWSKTVANHATRRLSCRFFTHTREQRRTAWNPPQQISDARFPPLPCRKTTDSKAYLPDRAEDILPVLDGNSKNAQRAGESARLVGKEKKARRTHQEQKEKKEEAT
jgi:hypothetical protein